MLSHRFLTSSGSAHMRLASSSDFVSGISLRAASMTAISSCTSPHRTVSGEDFDARLPALLERLLPLLDDAARVDARVRFPVLDDDIVATVESTKTGASLSGLDPTPLFSRGTIKELTFALREQQDNEKNEQNKLVVPLFLNETSVDECAKQCKSYFPALKRRMYVKYEDVDSLASFVCRLFARVLHHPSLHAALDQLAVDEFGAKVSSKRRVFTSLVSRLPWDMSSHGGVL